MASAAVQTLDISPVGRVEGDLDVRVDIQNGVVVNAWTSAEPSPNAAATSPAGLIA